MEEERRAEGKATNNGVLRRKGYQAHEHEAHEHKAKKIGDDGVCPPFDVTRGPRLGNFRL